MFHLISKTPRSNISNTRGSVSSDIQTLSSNISNTRESVSSHIHTPRSNISKTGRSFSFDIQTPRSNILNTKRSALSDSQTPRSVYPNTTVWPFHEYKNVEQTGKPNFQGLNYKHTINTITALSKKSPSLTVN